MLGSQKGFYRKHDANLIVLKARIQGLILILAFFI